VYVLVRCEDCREVGIDEEVNKTLDFSCFDKIYRVFESLVGDVGQGLYVEIERKKVERSPCSCTFWHGENAAADIGQPTRLSDTMTTP
jgi:hypothetical protein